VTDLLELQRTGLAMLNARLDGADERLAELCAVSPVTAGDLASLYLHVIVAAVQDGAIAREELSDLALRLGAEAGPI
jgi:hypothetical protein